MIKLTIETKNMDDMLKVVSLIRHMIGMEVRNIEITEETNSLNSPQLATQKVENEVRLQTDIVEDTIPKESVTEEKYG